MGYLFYSATSDALDNITASFDIIHPIRACVLYARNQIDNNGIVDPASMQNEIDPTHNIHGVNYLDFFNGTTWEQVEENHAWFLLNNLFAIHEGWVDRLEKELFDIVGGYTSKKIKQLEYKDLRSAFRSYFVPVNKKSATIEAAFSKVYEDAQQYDVDMLDKYMLYYRYYKEARNCYMHKNFQASQQLLNAYNEFVPIANAADLNLSVAPTVNVPVLDEKIHITMEGVINFSQILIRILKICDQLLIPAKISEIEILNRVPKEWKRSKLSLNQSSKKAQISKFFKKCGFLKPVWSQELEDFLVANNIFYK